MNMQTIDSPIGRLQLVSDGQHLTAIEFEGHHRSAPNASTESDPALEAAEQQLSEYFAGNRRTFDLPLQAPGTRFQEEVWQALQAIPYGELRSYRDIAKKIGREKAVRAVGAANGRNPLPIVVPCHRVIGSDGSLTGFAAGLETKKFLLSLEGAAIPV